jgi:hypothetical protein
MTTGLLLLGLCGIMGDDSEAGIGIGDRGGAWANPGTEVGLVPKASPKN